MNTNKVGEKNNNLLVVAVSGGVDSVVLLHMLVRKKKNLIVAHVDHGMRENSGDDAQFVKNLARSYDLPCRTLRLSLGRGASEERARKSRYNFLFRVARELNGRVVTGHHADDVVETVAINLTRSTGWRGLAGVSDPRILRPLTRFYKQELYNYAEVHNLEWREDYTNEYRKYLRNDIRHRLKDMPIEVKQEILSLWRVQNDLRHELSDEARNFITYNRYWYIMVPLEVAVEVLYELLAQYKISITRPQMANLLIAIKVAKPGTKYSLVKGSEVLFTKSSFSIQSVD